MNRFPGEDGVSNSAYCALTVNAPAGIDLTTVVSVSIQSTQTNKQVRTWPLTIMTKTVSVLTGNYKFVTGDRQGPLLKLNVFLTFGDGSVRPCNPAEVTIDPV